MTTEQTPLPETTKIKLSVVRHLSAVATTLAPPMLIHESSTDTSNCCEDCPDVNPNPPSISECDYFEQTQGGPVCRRPDDPTNRFLRDLNN